MNGLYCTSGLAYYDQAAGGATCTNVFKIMQGDKILSKSSMYKCDPTDNTQPCRIYYTATESFDVPCKCALDGKTGYCASVIGTDYFTEALSFLKSMAEKSACHTLDRNNYKA